MQCRLIGIYCSSWVRQRGASLIEVLVAVVLLSTGLIGMAGLLHDGTRFNHAAYLRSQGTALAADMLDRMRAHRQACAAPDVGLPCVFIAGNDTGFDASVGPACGESLPAAPPGVTLAAAELNQWKSCLALLLPEGRGRVSRLAEGSPYIGRCGGRHEPAPIPLFVIEVHWVERRLPTAGDAGRECVVLRAEVGA